MIELDDDKLINREISWLQFNERVLQEALDESNPLLERVSFMGIFSNNRDEFFRVRIATLRRMVKVYEDEEKDPTVIQKVLTEVDRIVKEQEQSFTWAYRKLVLALYRENIVLLNEHQLTEEQGKIVRKHFREKVRPYLFPIMLDLLEKTSMLKDRSIYLAIDMEKSTTQEKDYALVKVPSKIHSRFLNYPTSWVVITSFF